MTEEETPEEGNISLKVEDVMIREIITIDENATVKEAAEVMNENDISCLIAARKGKAIGIITERDLLKRVIVEAKNPRKTKVAEVMSTPLKLISPDTTLEDAVRVMFDKKIKKLPVAEKNQIIGLVSLTDIARCQPAIMRILKTFANVQNAPKSMKKVLDMYIV
jgi:CBS domain-containing protein